MTAEDFRRERDECDSFMEQITWRAILLLAGRSGLMRESPSRAVYDEVAVPRHCG